MTFKQIVQTVPYYKEHPEFYKRDDWYFFPEDESIWKEDLTALLAGSPKRGVIYTHALQIHDLNKSRKQADFRNRIESKESFARWLFELHDIY